MMNFDANKNGKIEKDEFTNFVIWCIAKGCADYFAAAGNTKEAALAGVKKMGKGPLTELKSLAKPPAGVGTCLACLGLLLGKISKVDAEWKEIQKMVGNTNEFIKALEECTEPKEVGKVKKAMES